jgi:glycosyltransferase involved in cell wall biosynthesis
MQRADIVVLNDMHPEEFPGAASIAYSHAKYLSTSFHVSFWHTTLSSGGVSKDMLLEVRSFHCNPFFYKLVRKYMATRILFEFTSFILLIKLLVFFARKRPKLVWVNQIGVRFPRTICLFLTLMGIKSVQTFHDFGVISPRKLYPYNLSTKGKILLSENRFIDLIYSFRRYILICIANRNHKNICISELQASIYRSAGVNNIDVISNGIEICNCLDKIVKVEKRNEVLFAGRSTGKGFERICRIIGNNPGWTLLIAGESDLEETAKETLNNSQFVYLGFLKPREIFEYIHRVKFVAVISDCYDVYPTVALEGLMHNSRVLATCTTGIATFLEEFGGGVLLDSVNSDIDVHDLYKSCSNQEGFPLSLISIETSSAKYSLTFLSAF